MKRLRNTVDACRYLYEMYGITRSPKYLAKLRVIGGGPKFRRIGTRGVGYEDESLDDYAGDLISEPVSSTSQLAA